MDEIWVAETIRENNNEPLVNLKSEITKQEHEYLNSAFKDLGILHSISEIKDIVITNGIEYKKYVDRRNLSVLKDNGIFEEQILLQANRYILNYASSIKTYLDIEKRLLTKNKPERIDDFDKLTHYFYDSHMEYRFWCNFRNYVVHCALPYTIFHGDIETGYSVVCRKAHLLEFSNWKHSKKDIEEMPENIELPLLVDNMSSLILALYLDFYSYWAEDIVNSIKTYSEFCKKYSVKHPIIVRVGENHIPRSMQPLPIRQMREALDVLRSNPHIKINIIDNYEC